MGIEKALTLALLKNEELVDQAVETMVEDPDAMDDLAGDIADKLSDLIEDDQGMRRRILDAAVASEDFRKRVVKELIEKIT